MYSKIVKSMEVLSYFEWVKENNYSILSPRHRNIYAEMIFRKFCKNKNIFVVKINPFIEVLEQISSNNLKKIQIKELKKIGKIRLGFFCIERGRGFFAEVRMGTSQLSTVQRKLLREMKKNNVFLFQVFEDAEMLIKKISYL